MATLYLTACTPVQAPRGHERPSHHGRGRGGRGKGDRPFREEMAIWQGAGIPAADVLRSATLVPAQFMGLGDRLGSISEGETASMVLVRAGSSGRMSGTHEQIEGVFLRGHYFSRDDLDRLLAEALALARRPAP